MVLWHFHTLFLVPKHNVFLDLTLPQKVDQAMYCCDFQKWHESIFVLEKIISFAESREMLKSIEHQQRFHYVLVNPAVTLSRSQMSHNRDIMAVIHSCASKTWATYIFMHYAFISSGVGWLRFIYNNHSLSDYQTVLT